MTFLQSVSPNQQRYTLKQTDLVTVNGRPGIIVGEPDKDHWTVEYKSLNGKIVRETLPKIDVRVRGNYH